MTGKHVTNNYIHKNYNQGFLKRMFGYLKKNYRIIRLRLEINGFERRRKDQHAILGLTVYKLMKNKNVDSPEQEKLMESIKELDNKIKEKTTELLDLVQKID